MRRLAVFLFLPCLGCNAIFGVEPGKLDPGMIHLQGEPFEFALEVDQGGTTQKVKATVHVDLTHAFALDEKEVTVARFKAWMQAGHELPAAGASLDPGGTYRDAMHWSSGFDGEAGALSLTPAAGCTVDEPYDGADTTTFEIGQDDYPMTCVRWAQAVAFCAFEHKRLPTNAEWQFAAQGGGDKRGAPFAFSGKVTCADAIVDADDRDCHFPQPVGTAKGKSKDGVLDMGGSVAEWTWDATDYDGRIPLASTEADDYAGTMNGAMEKHLLRGGEYFTDASHAETQNGHAFAGDSDAVSDVGFRCARTLLPPD